jgi:hypothetical protein
MKIKHSKSLIIAVLALAIGVTYLWSGYHRPNARVMMVAQSQAGASLYISHDQTNDAASLQRIEKARRNFGFQQKAKERTDAEKAELTNIFVTKLKPAAEKWALIYSNRVPFNLADLKMDNLKERIVRDSIISHSYVFVMGDITFGIAQYNDATQVQYLTSRRGLAIMRTPPTTGAAPDLSMPVTREQVMAMAEADSGVQYPPNEYSLIPSAESNSLAGGAIVNVGSQVYDAMDFPISKESSGFSYVFSKDGKLVYYLRMR